MNTIIDLFWDVRARAHWHLQNRLFERRYRTNTNSAVDLAALGLAGEERVDYVASDWRTLAWVLDPDEITGEDVFLDLGAGKGRMVIAAATHYGFGRVLGVELSPELAATAADNLAAARGRFRCPDVTVEVGDATTVAIDDAVTVVYLFNPFVGDTFRRVMENIDISLRRAPRRLRVIYRNPVEDAVVREYGFRAVRTDLRGPDRKATHLYEREISGSSAHIPAALG